MVGWGDRRREVFRIGPGNAVTLVGCVWWGGALACGGLADRGPGWYRTRRQVPEQRALRSAVYIFLGGVLHRIP